MSKVAITNFDEVKLHLRKELGILSERLDKSVKSINGADDPNRLNSIRDLLGLVKLVSDMMEKIGFNPNINVNVPDVIVPEIKVPDIHVPEIKVPKADAPIVNVPAPIVNVSASDVNIDLASIVDALEPLQLLSDDPKKPISVRLSDGKEFIKVLKTLVEGQQQLVAYSSSPGYVTIDNPISNPVKVSLVSGTITGGGNGYINDGVDENIKATVLDLTSANPLTVAITDANGDQITSFGGGTQYADGAVRGTATGTLAMGDDGTNIQSVKVDSSGVLAIQDNGGSLTVDGTVAVTNAGLTALNGAISGTEVQVDVVSSALPTGAATAAAQTDKSQFTKITDGTDTALVTASGEMNVLATAQPGVDIGDVTINNASGASAVNIQDGGNSITVDGTVAISGTVTVGSHAVTNAGTFAVQTTASATDGCDTSSIVSAASTNATSVKASAGTVYSIQVYNINASPRYLKLYNKASSPTVGTDVPVKRIMIPGNTSGAGSNITIPSCGIKFSTGIAFALTTGIADSDSTGVAANEILVNLDYK